MTLLEICEWLETTAFGAIARESLYGFQILVGIHILGLIGSVGTLLWMDLRMLGLGLSSRRLSEVYRSLAPWFVAGFGVMVASGVALFAGFAASAYGNTFFRIKLAAMALAGMNAIGYHVLARRMPESVDVAALPPAAVRLAGLASLLLWTTVILMGRMMSYTLF